MNGRTVVWFSCGAASAVAAKLAIDQCPDAIVAYIDTGSEHPDNARFLADVSRWIDQPITTLRSATHRDIWDVFERRKYIAGIAGAPCTLELKKAVRERWEKDKAWQAHERQVFGYDATEQGRADRFKANQPEVNLWCPLIDAGIPKELCFHMLADARIALPTMYLLGYRNNNCIGCVKGNAGYWNKIRRDFPDVFDRMAKLERRLGARICQATINGVRKRVHLDELPTDAGRYSDEPPITCGLLCNQEAA